MRAIILVVGAALVLAACGKNNQTDTNANVGDGLTAENIVSNDVTAIDAVTGDAANMAADMPVDFTNEMGNDLGNAGATGPASRPAARPRPSTATPAANAAAANETAPDTNAE
jgi:hypothetical protein